MSNPLPLPLPLVPCCRACRLQAPAHVKVCGTKSSVGLVLPPGAPQLEVAMMSHLLHGLFPETTFDANPNAMEASFLPFDIYGNPGTRREHPQHLLRYTYLPPP